MNIFTELAAIGLDRNSRPIPRALHQMERAASILGAYGENGAVGALQTLYYGHENLPFSTAMLSFVPMVVPLCIRKIWDTVDALETDAAHDLRNLVLAVGTLWPLAGDESTEAVVRRLAAAEPYLRLFEIDATGQSELSVLKQLFSRFPSLAVDVLDDWQSGPSHEDPL